MENVQCQLATAKEEVEKPFVKEAELLEKLERLAELNVLLNMDEKSPAEAVGLDEEDREAVQDIPERDMEENIEAQIQKLPLISDHTEPEGALNGLSRAVVEETVLCYAQAQIEEAGLDGDVELLGARVCGSRTREGTVISYYVEKNGFTVIENFISEESGSSGTAVSIDTTNFKIEGKAGSWLAFDSIRLEGQEFFLMEHETYGKEAALL